MLTHFFNADTQNLIFTAPIPDNAPVKGDVFASFDGKNYLVVQRTYVAVFTDVAPQEGIINIAATPSKQLTVELQILLMEISVEGAPSEGVSQ